MQIIMTAPVILTAMGKPSDQVNGYKVEIIDAPVLTGTDKQMAWAEAIRDAAIKDVAAAARRVRIKTGRRLEDHDWRGPEFEEDLQMVNEMLASIAAALASVTEAKAWIEAAGGAKDQRTVRALMRARQ
jgi:hypothetical protein